jgi:hypothetical protein
MQSIENTQRTTGRAARPTRSWLGRRRSRRAPWVVVMAALAAGAGSLCAAAPSAAAPIGPAAVPAATAGAGTAGRIGAPAAPDGSVTDAARATQAALVHSATMQRERLQSAIRNIAPLKALPTSTAPLASTKPASRPAALGRGETPRHAGVVPGTAAPSLAAALAAGGDTFANYAYRTIYTPTSGTPVTRYTEAVLGKSTPVNVTGSGSTQFKAEITPSTATPASLPGLTLSIDSTGAIPASDKVSIEAVLVLPSSYYLGIGEDGSTAGTATDWSATVAAGTSWTSSSASLGLNVSTSSPPASLATLGEIFSGTNPDSPTGDSRGDISFAPVPATSTTDINLAASEVTVQITSGSATPSVVNAAVKSLNGTKSEDFSARIDDLNSSASLVYDTGGGEQDLSYTGVGSTSQLDANYTVTVSGKISQASVIDATGLPEQVSLAQLGSELTFTTPGGGSITSIEARYGNGSNAPASPSGTGAYLSYDKTASADTAGARLDNLESLTLDAAQPYAMNLQMSAPLSSLTFSSSSSADGLTASGTVSSLPRHTSLSVDLTATSPPTDTLNFDGYGSPIGRFQVAATKTPVFFEQVTTIDATLTTIPTAENFGFDETEADLGVTASAPIGNVSLLMSDGTAAPKVSGPDLDFVDTSGHFLGYVNLDGFESVSYTGKSGTPLSGSIQVAGAQAVGLGASTPYGTFSGSVNQLAATTSFALTMDPLGDQVVTVNASAPIGLVEIAGTGVKLPVPATNVAIRLLGVPKSLTLSLPGPGQGFGFKALAPVAGVEAQAWQSGAQMNTAFDTLYYDNRVGQYRAAVMMAGLYGLSFDPATTTKPLIASVTTNTPTPYALTTTVLLDGQTNPYAAVACPSTTQCTASLGGGQLLTFNPLTPSAHTTAIQLQSGVAVTAIACPSTTQCTAIVPERSSAPAPAIGTGTGVVGLGAVVTFDPNSATVPTPVVIDPNQPLSVLSCPSTGFCVAADANEDTFYFDPTSAGTTTKTDNADNSRFGATTGLACPSGSQCTAVTDFAVPPFSTGYQEYPFDPTSFAILGAGEQVIVANRAMSEISCPSSGQCTIVDAKGKEYTFPPLSKPLDIDGGKPRSLVPTVLAGSSAFACPSTSQCTVLAGGKEETFNPVSGTAVGTYLIDPASPLISLSCPSATQCTAVDDDGQELTFDPQKPVIVTGNGGVKGLLSRALIGSKWEITSEITNLPASISLVLTPGSGAFSAVYSGSTPIESLTVDASGIPISQYATQLHVDMEKVPTGISLQIPSSGGEITFSPCAHPTNCDSVVGSLIAQLFGGVPTPLAHLTNQGIVYDEVTGEASVSLSQVGPFAMTESASPLHLAYSIAAVPLDVDVTLGQLLNPDPITNSNPAALATYLDVEITNPAPGTTVNLSTSNDGANGVFLNYYAEAAISEIQLVTNIGRHYFSGILQNLPQNLTVCANTTPDQGVSAPCNLYCPTADLTGTPGDPDSDCLSEPVPTGWLPERTGPVTGGWGCEGIGTESSPCPGPTDGYEIFQTDDAWLQILPTDESGNPPSTPMTATVLACPNATEYECQSDSPVDGIAGDYPAVLSIDGLEFSTVELGFGSGSTSASENYAWGVLNTDPTFGVHVDQLAMWSAGVPETKRPMLLIDNTNSGKGYITGSRLSIFGEQTGLEGKAYWNGSWSCHNPLNLYVDGISQDLAPLIGC